MTEYEIRLECLKLAVGLQACDPVKEAARMEAFINGTDDDKAKETLAVVRQVVSAAAH